jgi:hypothetical protein
VSRLGVELRRDRARMAWTWRHAPPVAGTGPAGRAGLRHDWAQVVGDDVGQVDAPGLGHGGLVTDGSQRG